MFLCSAERPAPCQLPCALRATRAPHHHCHGSGATCVSCVHESVPVDALAHVSVYMCVPVCMHMCAHMCTRLQPPFPNPSVPPETGAPLSYQGMALLGPFWGPPLQHLVSTWPGQALRPGCPQADADCGLSGRGFLRNQTESCSGVPAAHGYPQDLSTELTPSSHCGAGWSHAHQPHRPGRTFPGFLPGARPLPSQDGLHLGTEPSEGGAQEHWPGTRWRGLHAL